MVERGRAAGEGKVVGQGERRSFFQPLKNDFSYHLHLCLPLLRGALMFYSSGFAVY